MKVQVFRSNEVIIIVVKIIFGNLCQYILPKEIPEFRLENLQALTFTNIEGKPIPLVKGSKEKTSRKGIIHGLRLDTTFIAHVI